MRASRQVDDEKRLQKQSLCRRGFIAMTTPAVYATGLSGLTRQSRSDRVELRAIKQSVHRIEPETAPAVYLLQCHLRLSFTINIYS